MTKVETTFQTKLGKTIKYHRKKAGLSRIELADLANVGKTALFDIENGKKSVQISTVLSLLEILNISITLSGPLDYLNEKQSDGN